jgi:DNA-binding CsgD family transcriptional regulator/tetratricopeptide (TPR) repeat protein
MPTRRSSVFRGRTSERDQLRGLLDKVREGESAALVVRGEAGIGKTALIDHCVEQADGVHVVSIAGIESEMELPFAGLHQLCASMLPQVESLPEPQQNALRVAFGLVSGDAPDRFLVALATLGLLSEVALQRPLAVVVDDAQWLDAASAQVFGFVGRRILAESVLMLFAVREPTEDRHLAGLPEVLLHGLTDHDARALLLTATPGRVDVHVRDRIVAETRGNPLALLELPVDMTAAELAGGFVVPHSADLPLRLEENFLRRLEALPEATQRLMLVAAADPTGDVTLLWRAAATLGIGRDAAAAADAEQLVEIGGRVRFRHPLVRSAIYSGVSVEDRRAVHLALAAAMDPEIDPDRRVWHLASAAAGPDEEVASELERSAGRAQSRGGLAAAAAFLQRSVALTQDPDRRADRALAAAQAQLQAGAVDEALRLLAAAEIDAQTELQRARVDLLRGKIASAGGPSTEASAQLLKAARRLEPLDVSLARATYLDAWAAAMLAGLLGKSQLREVSEAARAAPPSPDPHLPDLLLDGLSLLIAEGLAAATPTLRQAVRSFPHEELSVEKGLQWGALASTAAATLWDFGSMEASNSRQTELARRAGALAPLCITLTADVFNLVWRGELAAAAALAAEAETVSDATGIRIAPYGPLLLAGVRGDERHGLMFIEAVVEHARARGEGTAAQVGLWANAVLYNGLARYEQALPLALQASEEAPEFFIGPWALPELIEAAVRTSNDALAARAVERLAGSTRWSESDWGRGIFARCQALVSRDETAEECYREAIDSYSRTPLRPDQARAHLLYGEWLRRRSRRVDARDQLRIAHDMFTEIGMLAFAERALHELRATGATVRKRREDTRDDLTSQEELIARLAVEGRTNPEIGAQLFLSPRTVEWHLRKVFAKLGITSRRGLRDVLPAQAAVADRA